VAPGRALHLSAEGQAAIAALRFEGNIRELRNLLERASLLADGAEIQPQHLAGDALAAATEPEGDGWMTLEESEHRYLAWALARHVGPRRELAARLGLSERTLFRKLAALERERKG
jgi:two-component system response regulator HydG